MAAVGGERGVWLGEVGSGRQRWIRAHLDMAKDVAFSADGTLLATAGVDATIKLWALPSVREVATLRGHMTEVTALAFAPDGMTVASAEHGHGLRFWHLATLREVAWVPLAETGDRVEFSQDGRRLAVGLQEGRMRLFRTR